MMWLTLIRSRVAQAVAAIGLLALSVLAIRRDAANDALRKHKEQDLENANRLRADVERNLDDRVRDYDGHGYRD